jgi:UDP-N-acetylmuramyl pentapeptide phosphotransferase/UDP-N-acetylglucosamine-1-phosphate transferase
MSASVSTSHIPSTLTTTESWTLTTISLAALAVLLTTLQGSVTVPSSPLHASLSLSLLAFSLSYAMIRWLGPSFMRAGLKGRDLSKHHKREIPECMGAVCAIVYLLVIIIFIPFPFYKDFVAATSGGGNRDVVVTHTQVEIDLENLHTGRVLHRFPHSKVRAFPLSLSLSLSLSLFPSLPFPSQFLHFRSNLIFSSSLYPQISMSYPPSSKSLPRTRSKKHLLCDGVQALTLPLAPTQLASHLSAILTLQASTLLGVGDDLFDIPWRHKFLIPTIASIPLLTVYFVDFGVTSVVIPLPLRPYLGDLFDLGFLYYLYMAAVATFCPQSINILAGINGIEVGQSVVIALLLLLNDALYLSPWFSSSGATTPVQVHPATDSHLLSTFFLLPFLSVSLALFAHNKYPAAVFVGDTYCYFAGMVFATVGILGHFSKTLLLLFIPQILNFLYSALQLAKIVPCPRHRLPRFNARTGKLEVSVAEWPSPPSRLLTAIFRAMHKLRLLAITLSPAGEITSTSNLTLINLWLVWRGPLKEDRLCWELLGMQAAVGLGALWARHRLALWVFTVDNL